eukprot:TRINITY_DN3589_c0_g1_i2.p1 TRINITY_DN3589_c0_g1~~TRINITY_DN3589_c0_g1_i2.p1  ORF type:complete len:542 (-),score=113.52 TRINITY_DN3589_c0_g1_i2:2124-3749(-)
MSIISESAELDIQPDTLPPIAEHLELTTFGRLTPINFAELDEEDQEIVRSNEKQKPRQQEQEYDKKGLLTDSYYVATNIPLRMDRLPWRRWHWIVVSALGISWILDGFEVTIVGVIGAVLLDPRTLNLTSSQVGLAGTIYILGCIIGSLIFGFLADKYGRQKLFIATPCVYLIATLLTGFCFDFASFGICQFVKGLGIGGEYSAMNSAINELIPARVRGWVDLVVNGSYWIGAVLASCVSIILLDPRYLPVNIGWRLPFAIGGVLGIFIIVARVLFIPESPRWLLVHDRIKEAEEIIADIERKVAPNGDLPAVHGTVMVPKSSGTILDVIRSMANRKYARRSIVGLSLMISQAFFYNAIFFSYALILTEFYHVEAENIGLYLIPFALGNFFGCLIIGRFFDTIGRKKMTFFTYTGSGILLIITGILFVLDLLNALTQTVCWSVIFFFASAAASSAYLTISEVFPVEIRAMAISVFYSLGTGIGGLIGPVLFGMLIDSQKRINLVGGYIIGAGLMMIAAVVALIWGVDAEGKSLEEIDAAEH